MAPRLRSSLAPPSPSILGAPPQNHRRRSSTPPPPLSVNPSPLQQAEISLAGSLKKQQKDAQVTLSGTSQSQTKQVMLSRLPTKDRLHRWGVTPEALCVLCEATEETHQHLFFECRFSAQVWNYYAVLCRQNPPQASTNMCIGWKTQHTAK
ncbi:PREDICTED: uncharacterized protein LOC104816978 isoform X2 [Tarenaya hassleriana]|uniref:uncharacterized protein LOC104816978 isoform X2 n=1 Tax=Tarenaya hassleriana TaxID=28532 RepID=UPI00053C81E0|nr:PREDICTED: uncharacterized protein LOC104816978 isoform X2 [Tarenaya hassleriana]